VRRGLRGRRRKRPRLAGFLHVARYAFASSPAAEVRLERIGINESNRPPRATRRPARLRDASRREKRLNAFGYAPGGRRAARTRACESRDEVSRDQPCACPTDRCARVARLIFTFSAFLETPRAVNIVRERVPVLCFLFVLQHNSHVYRIFVSFVTRRGDVSTQHRQLPVGDFRSQEKFVLHHQCAVFCSLVPLRCRN